MTEAEAVTLAAEKYRAGGYTVTVGPDPAELPAELRERRPSLVATKNGRSVLVEVWPRDRLNDLPPTLMPAGWDFDAVLLPRPSDETIPAGADATPEFSEQLLTELNRYLPPAATQARLLVGWSAAEAALRVAAQRAGLPAVRVTSRRLIGDLEYGGVLSDEQAGRLRALLDVRNRLAHGSPIDPVPAPDVEFLASLARELLAADPVKAAG